VDHSKRRKGARPHRLSDQLFRVDGLQSEYARIPRQFHHVRRAGGRLARVHSIPHREQCHAFRIRQCRQTCKYVVFLLLSHMAIRLAAGTGTLFEVKQHDQRGCMGPGAVTHHWRFLRRTTTARRVSSPARRPSRKHLSHFLRASRYWYSEPLKFDGAGSPLRRALSIDKL
jgi:hypothetical protein